MNKSYFLVDDEVGKVKINPGNKAYDIFTVKDTEYLEDAIRKRPLDLDLHIAIYILESEGLRQDLLEDVKEWVRDNPVAGQQLSMSGKIYNDWKEGK